MKVNVSALDSDPQSNVADIAFRLSVISKAGSLDSGDLDVDERADVAV
jgi:hypothetical protein